MRTLLKRRGDELVLIAVNVERAPVELEIRFGDAAALPSLRGGSPGRMPADSRLLRDRLEGLDARVYRLQLRRP